MPYKKKEDYKKWHKKNEKHVKRYSKEYYLTNKAKIDAQNKAWAAKNPDKIKAKQKEWYKKNAKKVYEKELIKKYGPDALIQYQTLFEAQCGECAICSSKDPGEYKSCFCIDHDHDTGHIRGLLCSNCNRALGLLQDDSTVAHSAAAYLKHHGK